VTRISSFRDLTVWQRSLELTVEVYRLTAAFPREEQFGLTSQLRRAAVSVAANIAEGHGRTGKSEYRRFVSIARGSANEVEALVLVATKLGFTSEVNVEPSLQILNEVCRMLTVLRRRLGSDAGA
jgi:four helix bundle protein